MLLPANKPKNKDITPKVFFIWGQSMSGKTYLARQFPSPVIINTDGNAKKLTHQVLKYMTSKLLLKFYKK